MPKANLTNFLLPQSLEGASERDGDTILEVLCAEGWNPDVMDPYDFVSWQDPFTQVNIIRELFGRFGAMTARDKDTAFGMFIWCVDNDAFDYLLENDSVCQLLDRMFAGASATQDALTQFGCGNRKYRARVNRCQS